MERRRLADILPISKALLRHHLATSRRRSILIFRLPIHPTKKRSQAA
ncbi:hypothetical protein [Kingella sp. (in: b-proteobacteria)]|nr:hypothetical protein [Kingella sp. (in: b-proteobacteria)]MDO4657282.1 hypothetical protein [Kingella sp. (in: b-proteobacteria)]